MVGDLVYVLLLLGFGVDEFSMMLLLLFVVKYFVCVMKMFEVKKFVKEVMELILLKEIYVLVDMFCCECVKLEWVGWMVSVLGYYGLVVIWLRF